MTTQIARKETRCRHMGYSFRLAARVHLYASSHRQDNTYHGLCYTSRGALAGTRNSPIGQPWRIDPTTHRTMSERYYHGATSRSRLLVKCLPEMLSLQNLTTSVGYFSEFSRRSEIKLRGKSVRSWCGGSSDRSFIGWTHWAISRPRQCPTTSVTKAMVCIILSVVWWI